MNRDVEIKELLIWLIVVLMIGFGVFIAYKNWTVGSEANDYDIVCLDGHEYLLASFTMKAVLSVRLTDEGKPVDCK